MKVKVLRAFLIGGLVQPVGKVFDLPDGLAREMWAVGKVEPTTVPEPVKGTMTTKRARAIVKGPAPDDEQGVLA